MDKENSIKDLFKPNKCSPIIAYFLMILISIVMIINAKETTNKLPDNYKILNVFKLFTYSELLFLLVHGIILFGLCQHNKETIAWITLLFPLFGYLVKNIIVFSSVAGDRGKKNNSIYSSAKAGLTSYTNGLNQRLYRKKINVMNVKIGWLKTKMTSNLNLPAFLCSSKIKVAKSIYKSYQKNKTNIYVPGYWRYIMFVYRLIPDFIFKILK